MNHGTEEEWDRLSEYIHKYKVGGNRSTASYALEFLKTADSNLHKAHEMNMDILADCGRLERTISRMLNAALKYRKDEKLWPIMKCIHDAYYAKDKS